MPEWELTNFNVACSVLGCFISVYALFSYAIKGKLYLSDALVSFITGAVLGPVLGVFDPLSIAQGNPDNVASITYLFSRLALGIQLVIAGIQLPRRYLLQEWSTLAVLLLPGLTGMWICSSLLIWLLVPNLSFLPAFAIGACVSPTDPVLSSSIVHGSFADRHVPLELRRIITAESGANDGLGFPFLFLPLFIMKYTSDSDSDVLRGFLLAIPEWVKGTWFYVVILGVIYGAAIGWMLKELLFRADTRRFVDKESFSFFPIPLALLILGSSGILGIDDILACFITGNAFTFDDWYRVQTAEDVMQPTLDLVLNMSIFIWLGAVCPWRSFIDGSVISLPNLLLLAILILLLRRLPTIYLMRRFIPQLRNSSDALFMGFFGPIGISAMFYCYLGMEYLQNFEGEIAESRKLMAQMHVVVWFLVASSITVHGLCIPLVQAGLFLTQKMRRGSSQEREQGPLYI